VLLLAARPEALPFLESLKITPFLLKPLDEADARGLISTILGEQPEMEELVDAIALRAAGLPLAIEEFSAFVANQSSASNAQELRLPPRLENVFRARIDQLDPVATELCALCCAMGPAVPLPVLRLVAPLAGEAFEAAFQSLVDARILRADLSGHVQFSHQLFQEAGYKGITRKRREALHASLYAALNNAAGEVVVAPLELARHAELGGNDLLALDHLWKACEEAVGFAALETVRAIMHQARVIATRLDDAGKAYAARFSLLAFDALQQLGHQSEARDCFASIVDGTYPFPRETRVLAQSHLAMLEWIGGNLDRAVVHGRSALRDCATIKSLPILCYAEFCQAHVEFATGETQIAVERLQSIDARLSARHETARFGAMISIPAIMARSFASWYASDIGAFELAEKNARSVIALSEKLQHNYSRALGRMSSGYALLRRGEIDEASALLEQATHDCVEHNYGGLEPMASSWFALALLEQGKFLQANRVLDASEKLGHNRRILNSCHYYGLEARARLLALSGEGQAALAQAEAARAHASSQGDRVHTLFGMALCAELALKQNGPSVPLRVAIAEIRQDAEALGLKPLAERLVQMVAV
jgi:tetratricopeptide (TPR) repeat protein